MRRPLESPTGAILLITLLSVVPAGGARALEVERVRWGFDGRVVPERINLLSVLVRNSAEEPYDGALGLEKTSGMGRLGGRLVQPCYVSSFSSRWVQFHPYVGREHDEWVLRAGRERLELEPPRTGPPATVYLLGDRGRVPPGGSRTFPDGLFPTSVAATDGLGAVVVDHAPDWEPARRRAFLDWLRRGGRVHILPGPTGRLPRFTRDLAVLNGPPGREWTGGGLIVRHRSREAFSNELSSGPRSSLKRREEAVYQRFEDIAFRALRGAVKVEHNWALIYVLIGLFALLVVPANWLIGRRSRGFLRPLLFFLVTVGVFALLLGHIGRRGYGERAVVHGLSYARTIEPGRYDVTQWSDAFVTDGGDYTVTHDARHGIYSTCQESERVNAVIRNGVNGMMKVDMPLFSHRAFLHRAAMEGPELGVQVERWRTDGGLREFACSLDGDLPAPPIDAWLRHDGRLYPVRREGGYRLVARREPIDEDAWLGDSQVVEGYGPVLSSPDGSPRSVARQLCRMLLAHDYAEGGSPRWRVERTTRSGEGAGEAADLFVFAEAPPQFAHASPELGPQTGYVLYQVKLHKPEEQ